MKPRKIDVYFNGQYIHSTCFYKTCKDAKASALKVWSNNIKKADSMGFSAQLVANYTLFLNHPEKVKAFFDKAAK